MDTPEKWQIEFDEAQATRRANVICMKWGNLYSADWVNKLYGMVRRNTTWDIRFVCLTDDSSGIRSEVECLPFPELQLDQDAARSASGRDDPWWRKLSLYSESIHDLQGMTLYMDLDILITGNIDSLFTYPGRFCMMRVWRPERFQMHLGNSSIVRTFIGAESYILQRFKSKPHIHWINIYDGDQIFVSDTVNEITFYPVDWCISFKQTLPRNGVLKFFSKPKLPRNSKIVVFHGQHTPTASINGEIDPTKSANPKRRQLKFKRRFRPATWIEELWVE